MLKKQSYNNNHNSNNHNSNNHNSNNHNSNNHNKLSLEELISFVTNISKCHSDTQITQAETDINNDIKNMTIKHEYNFGHPFLDKIFSNLSGNLSNIELLTVNNEFTFSNKNVNIELYPDILYSLSDKYSALSSDQQTLYIERLIEKIIRDVNSRTFQYEFKINKKILIEQIRRLEINVNIIDLLAFYFDINILLFDCVQEKIAIMYSEPQFNIYKTTLLLTSVSSNKYHVIKHNKDLKYNNNSQLLNYILSEEFAKKMPNCFVTNGKIFKLGLENLDKYLDKVIDPPAIDVNDLPATDVNGHNDIKPHIEKTDQSDIIEHNITNPTEIIDAIDAIDTIDTIDTTEATELDEYSEANNNSKIFLPKLTTKTKVVSKINDNVQIVIDNKMKLEEIQKIATSFGIDLTHGFSKNGNPKTKTKITLINDITLFQNKK